VIFQKKWSERDTETLRKLAKTGKSYKQIGEILGYTRNACIGKARREGICKAPSDLTPRAKKFVPKPVTKAVPPTPIPPDIKAPAMLLIPMMELTSNNCRYPIGEDENTLFCGLPRHRGRPYCKQHADVCYKPMLPPRSSAQRL
jgi:GcrA cell cycle regulator